VNLDAHLQPMMNTSFSHISIQQLKRAIKLKTKLERLQSQLDAIIGTGGEVPTLRRKRRMSAAGRAAIAAGARRRWAKVNGNAPGKPMKRGKRKMSAAARARMSAFAKRRWKKAKAAGKSTL
jgi:hypothetical protein